MECHHSKLRKIIGKHKKYVYISEFGGNHDYCFFVLGTISYDNFSTHVICHRLDDGEGVLNSCVNCTSI